MFTISQISVETEEVAEGYCDGVTDRGGWLVVQRRQDSSVDFNRGWDFEEGFGKIYSYIRVIVLVVHT